MQNGMACDYSWTEPAKEYIQIYEEIVRRRSRAAVEGLAGRFQGRPGMPRRSEHYPRHKRR